MSNLLQLDQANDVLIVRFTRPEIRNPLSVNVLDELRMIIKDLAGDINAVVFTGTDDVFASGADLREIGALDQGHAKEFALRGQSLMSSIAELPQKTIAAVNGYCFGGALDLALACDVRIGSNKAKFAHPGTGLGIITGWGGTQRLPRLIGTAKALEMFFTASPVDAERALAIGLIDEIADPALDRALELSGRREI